MGLNLPAWLNFVNVDQYDYYIYVTCSAIWGLLDKDDDLRASYELLNTERFL